MMESWVLTDVGGLACGLWFGVLAGVKAIKMYGWESSFNSVMASVRDLELTKLYRLAMVTPTPHTPHTTPRPQLLI
jgi:hypothetical protein